MNILLPGTHAPCNGAPYNGRSMQWLVDVGELVPVKAVSARSAYFMATAGRYNEAPCNGPPEHPMVYQFDAAGELIAVFD